VASFIRADLPAAEAGGDFVDPMRYGWQLPIAKLLLLSGRDLTAREFEDVRAADPRWSAGENSGLLMQEHLTEADHTFSSARWRDEVAMKCVHFLAQL
jgi:hypothetical protein